MIVQSNTIRRCPACNSSSWHVKFIEGEFIIVRCGTCSLVYLGNPPDETVIYEEYYSSTEPDPKLYVRNSSDPNQAENFLINTQRIASIKKYLSSGTLLDIGCGRGTFLKSASDGGYDAYGIDVSERAVRYAQKEFHVRAEVHTLDQLIASGKQFDIITLWHVLEHFVDPYKALTQVRSLLNQNGRVFIEVPNLNSLKFILAKNKWTGGNHPLYHRTFFSLATLHRALQETGYSSTERIPLSYRVPTKSGIYFVVKKLLNMFSLDAFLDITAVK